MRGAVEIKVWADSRRSGACRSCKAPVTWVTTIAGKWMPFDGEPVALRTLHDPATRDLVEVLSADDTHWRTCPQAEAWRK